MDTLRSKLQAQGITLRFGDVQALNNFDMTLGEREILGVIGPDRAGKTSLVNSIAGLYKPQQGKILFEGRDISALPPGKRTMLGIARMAQTIALYMNLTVYDNILAARRISMNPGVALSRGEEEQAQKEIQHRKVVAEIIDLLELQSFRTTMVGDLPYNLRRRVELGRALALQPNLLLLDEPLADMNPTERADMARLILMLRNQLGITILLTGQSWKLALAAADRLLILEAGYKIAEEMLFVESNPAHNGSG
jgi:branched-chain amino acid transport system ATP-binding protein